MFRICDNKNHQCEDCKEIFNINSALKLQKITMEWLAITDESDCSYHNMSKLLQESEK
jgi:hypothetical protein